MNLTNYSDPIRGMERKLAPDYAQRELRDPGIRMMQPHLGMGMRPHVGGLGSLHHTMPHLRRLTAGTMHFQSGGLGGGNPVGELAAATRPNTFNPDPQFRQFMALVNQQPFAAPTSLRQAPTSTNFVYQEGGEVDSGDSMQDVQSPDDQLSPGEQQERQIVLNAMAALDGQSPDPEADLKAFINTFGARALADLQQLVEEQHQQQAQGDEGEQEEGEGEPGQPGDSGEDEDQEESAAQDMAQAGGGLLHGPGTGQSDEIEASTPSGRPVLLSDGEYVIDAPTVAALGDGSTKAGAKRLDQFRHQIRQNAYGHTKQAKPMAKAGGGVTVTLK